MLQERKFGKTRSIWRAGCKRILQRTQNSQPISAYLVYSLAIAGIAADASTLGRTLSERAVAFVALRHGAAGFGSEKSLGDEPRSRRIAECPRKERAAGSGPGVVASES